MEKEEVKKMLHEYLEKRVRETSKRTNKFHAAAHIYKEMQKSSKEMAELFRSIVWFTAALHPEWSEEEILEDFIANTSELANTSK